MRISKTRLNHLLDAIIALAFTPSARSRRQGKAACLRMRWWYNCHRSACHFRAACGRPQLPTSLVDRATSLCDLPRLRRMSNCLLDTNPKSCSQRGFRKCRSPSNAISLSTPRGLANFAYFLELQTTQEYKKWLKGESPEAGEEKWEKLFAEPEARRVRREMAREAREEYRAGRTTDMEITHSARKYQSPEETAK